MNLSARLRIMAQTWRAGLTSLDPPTPEILELAAKEIDNLYIALKAKDKIISIYEKEIEKPRAVMSVNKKDDLESLIHRIRNDRT